MNIIQRQIRRYSDSKLDKELVFARSFGPPITDEERDWLEALEAEAVTRADAAAECPGCTDINCKDWK